ncbi:MAG TPA: S24/S26 family peptidase [Polyangia bacterium]|nr:S24/S26 family peptidase [Polyangia bacterium]
MNLRPQAVRMVLAHGLPVVIEVVAESMAPSIGLGDKVKVEPATGDLHPGDIVLVLADDGHELLLHRVMHLFSEGARRYVIHQGDARKSIFATCPREAVVGRAIAFPLTPSRPLPTLDALDPAARARFQRRRRACALYSLARRLSLSLRLEDRALTRSFARAYRALARKVVG